jgi:hypothetical protein
MTDPLFRDCEEARTKLHFSTCNLRPSASIWPDLLLAQDQEIDQLMTRFQAGDPNGVAVQQLAVLVSTAIFKPANALVGFLLEQAADRIEAACINLLAPQSRVAARP